ncbi:DEAD/DEAH box helicase [Deinococcus sonorensis]|uniref:DEAD/DEAH box helicase n=2 Tax=Deinococcus sonorensis TaxID=309891 RepID=A0AAU7UEY7_9DEIO
MLQPVQQAALEAGLIGSAQRRNFIVSAPTNAGKTLVGDLACLDALRQGQRAVLLEPLRALAQEKHEEWVARITQLRTLLGRDIRVTLSTGDYRLEDEHFTDLPATGELIVATPEKLEALLRRPEHQAWFEGIGVVVVDEAHLISNPRRGPTLELLLSRLKAMPSPPRFVLLSGTVGNTDAAQAWLAPCEVVRVTQRTSPLSLSVLPVPPLPEGKADDVATEWLQTQLLDPAHRALVFVYQTASAEKLARHLCTALGTEVASAYHARLPKVQRDAVRAAFLSGETRVVVSTTALAMGLNLPCTHVLVRDAAFPGVGRVEVDTLLQMLGRAGRGQTPGTGAVVVKSTDGWEAEELRHALHHPQFADLTSAFDRLDNSERGPAEQVVATLLAAQVNPVPAANLEDLLRHSLGGPRLAGQVRGALAWLERQKLAYRESPMPGAVGGPVRFALTLLGRRTVRAVVPLPFAAGYAQLLRDLMLTEASDDLLEHWRPMDTLLLLNLLHERPPNLGWRFSEALVQKVDSWCEEFGADAPLLARYMRGAPETSRADELLGSLGIAPAGRKGKAEARKLAYLGLARAAVLFERSRGRAVGDVELRWSIKNLAGLEERWRDDLLWLLGGLGHLLDVHCFYFYLREHCAANDARVRRVKVALKRQRRQTYGLIEGLKRCSPLGGLLDLIRKQQLGRKPKIGLTSLRKLEDAGVTDLNVLMGLTAADLHALGLRRDFAQQVVRFLQRRRAA